MIPGIHGGKRSSPPCTASPHPSPRRRTSRPRALQARLQPLPLGRMSTRHTHAKPAQMPNSCGLAPFSAFDTLPGPCYIILWCHAPRPAAAAHHRSPHHRVRHARRGGAPVMPDYVPVLILMGLALAFAILVTLVTFVFGPKKPTPEKLAPYECGIEEIEPPRQRFPVKYLTTGMLFIIFDVEAAAILPLAILMRQLKAMGFIELLIFAVVLLVPFFYFCRKGAFPWVWTSTSTASSRASKPTPGRRCNTSPTPRPRAALTGRTALACCSPRSTRSSTGAAAPRSGPPPSAWPAAPSR